jgi:prolyl-tRNA synthetase
VLPGSYGRGIPVWQDAGLRAARRMVSGFESALGQWWSPRRVEHPFLMPAAEYKKVFGDYTNVYETVVPEAGGSVVLAPDNMAAGVGWLREHGGSGPLVAVGGLLRMLPGGAQPLFRDRHIWPAVQVTHLVGEQDALDELDRHRMALTRLHELLCLPVMTVSTGSLASYGRTTWLTVSCLPDGRPTVTATLYVMSDHYRDRLRAAGEVIDVGFTGKLLALVALHHRDSSGLVLPSPLADTQVGVLAGEEDGRLREWCGAQAREGVRVRTVEPGARQSTRRRAERRLLRDGVPLVVGERPGGPRIARRQPLRRADLPALPDPRALRGELAAHDDRLRRAAADRFASGLREAGRLVARCDACAATGKEEIFGRTVPEAPAPCGACGAPGCEVLLGGRFY